MSLRPPESDGRHCRSSFRSPAMTPLQPRPLPDPLTLHASISVLVSGHTTSLPIFAPSAPAVDIIIMRCAEEDETEAILFIIQSLSDNFAAFSYVDEALKVFKVPSSRLTASPSLQSRRVHRLQPLRTLGGTTTWETGCLHAVPPHSHSAPPLRPKPLVTPSESTPVCLPEHAHQVSLVALPRLSSPPSFAALLLTPNLSLLLPALPPTLSLLAVCAPATMHWRASLSLQSLSFLAVCAPATVPGRGVG